VPAELEKALVGAAGEVARGRPDGAGSSDGGEDSGERVTVPRGARAAAAGVEECHNPIVRAITTRTAP